MNLLAPILRFLFHLGVFGPLVMGILDSSFLILPFGNDLVVASLVLQHHSNTPWYILSAACGSTIGALLLVLASRKLGEEGLRKIAGENQYKKLKARIGNRAGAAIVIGGLAPPPFPFTTVIAATGVLQYPIWRILLINFFARAVRFTVLAILALTFGKQILWIANSDPFKWGMAIFIFLCIAASAFSIWNWLRKPRQSRSR
jgi:membrane protein YqaA with SNARE-associated domain